MGSALPTGSVAVVRSVATSDIGAGDIIAYLTPDNERTIVAHRVLEVNDEEGSVTFKTAGDENHNPDRNAISSANVMGRVLFYIPFLGYLGNFLRQPIGYGLIIGLPSIAVVLYEIRKVKYAIKRLRKRQETAI